MKFTNEMRKLLENRVDNAVAIENATKEIYSIHINGAIGESMWSYGYTSNEMQYQLKQANGKDVNVYINSGGGDVFEGIAIHNMLAQYEGKVTGIVTGLAGSSASVILMGCEAIQMGANTMIMIHRASTMVYGNADTMDETSKLLKQVDKSVTTSYKGKFKGTDEELDLLLIGSGGDGTWFTADEAIENGFADSISTVKLAEEKPEPDEPDEPDEPEPDKPEQDKPEDNTSNVTNELINEFEKFIENRNKEQKEKEEQEKRKQSANETFTNLFDGLNQFLGGKQ